MAEKSILIIGAGVAGLATGIFGRLNGYRTRIVEHHSEPGGVATAWPNQGYLIDGGIHYLMGHKPGQACYEIYRQLGIFENRRYPDLETFVRFTDEATGRQISFGHDLDQLERDLQKISPADAKLIAGFIAGAKAMRRADMFGLMETPPELAGIFGPLKLMWGMRRVLRYFGPEFNQPMEQYARAFQSAELRRIMGDLFLPDVPVWFVLLILGLLANKQMGLLEGSCADFVASIVERYESLGGEVQYSSTVKEILVENHRAVGVRFADGGEQRADVVVGAGDSRSTIFDLLGGRYVDKAITERFANWKLLPPVVTLSFGVKREFRGEPPLNFLFLKEPIVIGNVTVPGFPVRLFNYGNKFSPPGRTVVQALVHTDWDYWNDLQKDHPRYAAEKKRVADDVLRRLESQFPGITAQVEVADIATPLTTWRYTLNDRGAFMGWLPTPKTMRTNVKKTLPGLANFYMAGQWVMPGGGVPPSIYSGRQVIQLLCKRDGKKFSAFVA
ncbi:MAG: NAD(P)/FAD-dependent oxidoreductase [Verrucomicrobia bacterium]|nr:NAD(P)/FAD-dependent oxidoreductase [Verrucomicrobiota bacterium]